MRRVHVSMKNQVIQLQYFKGRRSFLQSWLRVTCAFPTCPASLARRDLAASEEFL